MTLHVHDSEGVQGHAYTGISSLVRKQTRVLSRHYHVDVCAICSCARTRMLLLCWSIWSCNWRSFAVGMSGKDARCKRTYRKI